MNGVKTIISIIFYYIGLIFNYRRNRVLSIYFHNPKPESFERIIKWAVKRKYEFIDLPQLLDYVEGKTQLKEKYLYVSFDDAWKGNLDLIPVIEKYKLPITIFSPVEPLYSGNYWWEYVEAFYKQETFVNIQKFKTLSEKEAQKQLAQIKQNVTLKRSSMYVEELNAISQNKLIDIQSHSYNHPILTNLSLDSLDFELKESKKLLSQLLNKDVYAFSYPNGTLNEREINAVKQYYRCAFTTKSGDPEFNSNPYLIKRIALTNDYWSNLAKITGGWNLIYKLKMKYIKRITKK